MPSGFATYMLDVWSLLEVVRDNKAQVFECLSSRSDTVNVDQETMGHKTKPCCGTPDRTFLTSSDRTLLTILFD